MEPLITIIVPVYKCEEYLDKCFSSIVSQTYKNLEILLVDDGSPGEAPKICDEWAKKDERIAVLHKTNGGPSAARNYGLDRASGEYIAMIDCDDYISPQFVEFMYRAASENDADVAVAMFEKVTDDNAYKGCIEYESVKKKVFGGIEMMDNFYNELNDAAVIIWNKLYSKSAIGKIRYPVDIINEDEAVIHNLYYNVSAVVVLDAVLNYYRMTPGSLMRSEYGKGNLDELRAKRLRLEFFKDKELVELFRKQSMYYCLLTMRHYSKIKTLIGKNPDFSKSTLYELYGEFKKYYPYAKTAKGGTRNQRILLRAANISPRFYGLITRISR